MLGKRRYLGVCGFLCRWIQWREDVGQRFWRERSAEREKRSLHLLREKVRRKNHEQDSERIGAWVFYLAQQNS